MTQKKYLIIIFLLGLFLRMYQLGNVPVGFHRDEAFLGYNAYSILETGKDITGNFLPIHLKSFLYSPAGYSYLSIPFIAIFGLNELSVRIASALFGSLTIILAFFLAKKIFNKHIHNKKLALLTAFLLAISPWHINLSRVATENVIVVFFTTLGALLYIHWTQSKKILILTLAFISFGITLLTYQAPRAFLPLFIPLLFLLYNIKPFFKNMKTPIILYLLITILPLLIILNSHELSQRISMLSIFNNPGTQLILDEQIREEGSSTNSLITRLFHNKAINYSETFLQNYTQHFSYAFLFTDSGLPDRYRIPNMGLMYLFELPILLIGIYKLISNKKIKKITVLLIGWILLAPVGSSLTFDDVPNLQRTLIIFPALSMITAFGLLELKNNIHHKWMKYSQILIGAITCYSILFYLHQYYIHQIVHRPWNRQEGYKELVNKINKLLPQYKKVIITNSESTPEIFFLFYPQYDPKKIQDRTKNIDWITTKIKFDKYTFSSSECPLYTDTLNAQQLKTHIKLEEDVLYVEHGPCKTPKKYIKTLSEIKRSDGTIVFRIVLPAQNK